GRFLMTQGMALCQNIRTVISDRCTNPIIRIEAMKPAKKYRTQETLVDQIRALLKISAYQPDFLRLIKNIEDRLRRKLRQNGLLIRKSRAYGTYMIEDYHGGIKDGPSLTLAQVIAFATSIRTVLTRHAIKQEIASVMYGKLQVAQIIG